MCAVSMVMDYGLNPERWKPQQWETSPVVVPTPGPTKEQFEELLKLLRAAKKFDEATGQSDCELESKKKLVREMAERLGVDVKDL